MMRASKSGLLHSLLKSQFVRSVATLASGKAAAQAIAIIAIPIISRLYAPADFGLAALFLSMALVGAAVANFGYDQAIVMPKETGDSETIAHIANRFALATSLFILSAIVIIKFLGIQFQWERQLGGWIFLIPLGVFLLALNRSVSMAATRTKNFRILATADVVDSGAISGLRVSVGFLSPSVAVLVGSLLAGAVARLVFILRGMGHERVKLLGKSSAKNMRILMYEYRHFPFFTMPSTLLNSIGNNLPLLALSILYDPAVVGLYAMGYRLLRLPVQLFTESVRRTFLQQSVELVHSGQSLLAPLARATGGLAVLGLVIFLPVLIFGEWFFSFFLGARWAEAGEFAQILTPFLFILFIRGPASATFVVLERQRLLMKLHVVSVISIATAFLLAFSWQLIPKVALGLLSVAGVLAGGLIVVTAFGISRKAAKS